jgi:hypothetical protein
MMHQKLPVELRDLVYEFLCVEPDRPIPVGPYYHFRKYDKPFHDPLLRRHYDDDHPIPFTWPPSPPAPYRAITENNAGVDVDMNHVDDKNNVQMSPELTERVMKMKPIRNADDMSVAGENDDNDTTILPDGRVKEVHTHKPPRDMPLPYSHFLDPRYVGPEAAYEIQKMYYTRNTFSICSVEQAIYSFSRNHSGYNIVGYSSDGTPYPVPNGIETKPPLWPRNHVRNLQVRVKFEQFYENMLQDHFSDLEKYAHERRFLRFTQQNLQGLEQFLRDRSKDEINIEFIIMTELLDFQDVEVGLGAQCNYVNFLQSVREWVYIMKYDCDNISVKVTHHDEVLSPFPRNITEIFGLTKEQWDHVRNISVAKREAAWSTLI